MTNIIDLTLDLQPIVKKLETEYSIRLARQGRAKKFGINSARYKYEKYVRSQIGHAIKSLNNARFTLPYDFDDDNPNKQ